jgi:DNA-binding transcriptional regulator PaaX
VHALVAAGLADYRRRGKMALYSLTERGRALL